MHSQSPIVHLTQYNCGAKFSSNYIYKFADHTTVVDRITNNDETEYRKAIETLVIWCQDNSLTLTVNKMKQLVIDQEAWWSKCPNQH